VVARNTITDKRIPNRIFEQNFKTGANGLFSTSRESSTIFVPSHSGFSLLFGVPKNIKQMPYNTQTSDLITTRMSTGGFITIIQLFNDSYYQSKRYNGTLMA